MPHAALRIVPGVDTNKTQALNEANVSASQLIRFQPDRNGLGLVQKLGGWTRYNSDGFQSVIRCMLGWNDLNANSYLACGFDGKDGCLQVISSAGTVTTDITPTYETSNILPDAATIGISTTSGSDLVTITDLATQQGHYNYVFFQTPVSVGNLLLQGPYPIVSTGVNTYSLNVGATTVIGNIVRAANVVTVTTVGAITFQTGDAVLINGVTDASFNGGPFTITATSSSSSTLDTNQFTYAQVAANATSSGGTVVASVTFGGTVAQFSTTNNNSQVTVNLKNHGYSEGDDFNAYGSTTVGGVTFSGIYTVVSVTNQNAFVIEADKATSTTTGYINGGSIPAYYFIGYYHFGHTSSLYGSGLYGVNAYGRGDSIAIDPGNPIKANDWTLDDWGQILIACPVGGAVYYWSPVGNKTTNASYITNAPIYNEGIFVAMPQRQIVAYGSSFLDIQDPLLVRWCDVQNFNVWTASSINQAGSYRIPSGSKIVGATQAGHQGILWTDLDVWTMQYIGAPLVYGFNKISNGCGLIGRHAYGMVGGDIYWMGKKQFFTMNEAGVNPLPCDVWDFIFQNIKDGNDNDGNPFTDRIRCCENSQFGEIAWHFPSKKGSGENDSYVKYNVIVKAWDYGTQDQNDTNVIVGRSAWIDQSVLGNPMGGATQKSIDGAGIRSYVYQHETDNDADGASMSCSFQTGYFALSDGDLKIFIDQVWPDMKWGQYPDRQSETLKITFYMADYPGDDPVVFGPYSYTRKSDVLSLRMRGRLVSIKIESTDKGGWWRLGATRYRFAPDGRY